MVLYLGLCYCCPLSQGCNPQMPGGLEKTGHTQPLVFNCDHTCSPVSVLMGTLQKLAPQNPKGALPSAILVNKAKSIMCPGLDRLRSKPNPQPSHPGGSSSSNSQGKTPGPLRWPAMTQARFFPWTDLLNQMESSWPGVTAAGAPFLRPRLAMVPELLFTVSSCGQRLPPHC